MTGLWLTVYFVLIIALPVALGGLALYKSLSDDGNCDLCRGPTIRLQSQFARFFRLRPSRPLLKKRWCPSCDWTGYHRFKYPDVEGELTGHPLGTQSSRAGARRARRARPEN